MSTDMKQTDTLTRTALITGASSGLGYELCKQFAQDHINIVLVARNETRLKEVGEEPERDCVLDPKTNAEQGYRAMQKGKMAAVPGVLSKLLAIACELPPRQIALFANKLLLSRS